MSGLQMVPISDDFRSSLPRKLYRRFSERAHAEAFIAGELRFQSLTRYRSIEDAARQDKREGSRIWNLGGSYMEIMDDDGNFGNRVDFNSGEFKVELVHAANYLIACFSTRQNARQKAFGPWLVTIHHADSLIRHIRSAFPHPDCLIWGRVDYYDPETPRLRPDDGQVWRKKPQHYRHEHEFRIGCVLRNHPNPETARARIVGADLSHVTDLVHSP